MLFFLHIPKSGGTTLNSVLDNNYFLEEFYQGYNLINKFEKKKDFIDTFNRLPPARKNQVKVIRSHFYFGLHHDLNIRDFTYIGLLREPVNRFISDYYFILENESHVLHDQVMGMSFEDYIHSEAIDFSANLQTRMMAGQEQPCCTQTEMEIAKENIKNHFSLVGLLERFDETLVLLKHKKILVDTCYVKQNPTPQRMAKDELPPHLIKAIEKINQWDILLYRWVQEKFAGEVAAAGVSFKEELRNFLELNKVNTDPDFYNGYRLFRKGQWEKSKSYFEKSLESKAHTREALEIKSRIYFYLGEIYRLQGGNPDYYYRKSLEFILKKKMTGTNNTYMIGSLFKRLGEYEKAREWFRKITQCFLQGTIMGNAYFHLGEIHLESGEIREAKSMFRKTLMYNHVHKKAQNYLTRLDKMEE